MSPKPVNTRRSTRPVECRADRRPLVRRHASRLIAAQPLAPTFARLGRRRQANG